VVEHVYSTQASLAPSSLSTLDFVNASPKSTFPKQCWPTQFAFWNPNRS
jgi:hypothetical protein